MTIQRPDNAWRPLQLGVLKYPRSKAFSEMSPADLIETICKETSFATDGLDLSYDAEDGSFTIYFPGAAQPGDGTVGGTPESAFHDFVVAFQLGDDPEAIDFDYVEPSKAQRESLKRVVEELQDRFESLLHVHLASGLCKVFARVGTPFAGAFSEIPPDVFEHFKITDWRRGVARALAGERLYSIFLADVEGQTQAASDPVLIELNQPTKKAAYANYLLKYHNGKRPPGWPRDEIRRDFFERTNRQRGTLDAKTMTAGEALALKRRSGK